MKNRMSGKRKVKKKARTPYTKGELNRELNRLIDSLCHPLSKRDKGFILVDGLLHAMVEQNPPITVQKFIKYSLPKLLEETGKKSREDQY
jgi:hypothetical protein